VSDVKNIKTMKLYRHPERIYSELDAAGYKRDVPLRIEDISLFDQYHYLGTDAVDDAILSLNIDSQNRVIDIGSGIGGPARYLAKKTGCHVTALELQPDLHNIACSLTERCGLSEFVEHLCGDILDFSGKHYNFDVLVSLLTFLHIPDRSSLLKKCYDILKPDGKIFVEDFCRLDEFDEKEIDILSGDVYCLYLPTSEEYGKQLAENGFTDIELIDKTDSWKNSVRERMEKFIENRNRNISIHDIEIVEELEDFYKKMSRLFDGGNLGGLRIIAKKEA